MGAKDYKICMGWQSAYIAKTSKRDPDLMLEDRKEITENEILALIHWWAIRKKEETGKCTQTLTADGKPVVVVELLKEEEVK